MKLEMITYLAHDTDYKATYYQQNWMSVGQKPVDFVLSKILLHPSPKKRTPPKLFDVFVHEKNLRQGMGTDI